MSNDKNHNKIITVHNPSAVIFPAYLILRVFTRLATETKLILISLVGGECQIVNCLCLRKTILNINLEHLHGSFGCVFVDRIHLCMVLNGGDVAIIKCRIIECEKYTKLFTRIFADRFGHPWGYQKRPTNRIVNVLSHEYSWDNFVDTPSLLTRRVCVWVCLCVLCGSPISYQKRYTQYSCSGWYACKVSADNGPIYCTYIETLHTSFKTA